MDQHFVEELQKNETNENHSIESTNVMVENQGEEKPLIESIIRPSDIPKLLDDEPNHSHPDEETFENTEKDMQTQQNDDKILREEKDSADNMNQKMIDDDEKFDHSEGQQEYAHNHQAQGIKEHNISTYETNEKGETVHNKDDMSEANIQTQQQETKNTQEHIKQADEKQPEEVETNFIEEFTVGDVHHDMKAQN